MKGVNQRNGEGANGRNGERRTGDRGSVYPRRYAILARVRRCFLTYFLGAGVGGAAAGCLAGAKISFLAAAHFFC